MNPGERKMAEMGLVTEGRMAGGGGCINGLLHFFERRYFFSGRRGSGGSHGQKKKQKKKTLLLTGEPAVVVNKKGEQRKTELTNIRNIRQENKTIEAFSPSSSTSSCSSPFSSKESYKTALPTTPFPLQTVSPRSPAKLPRRFSFDGVETGELGSRTGFGVKDLPRLSLGSRDDSRFSLSSVSASPPVTRKPGGSGTQPEPGSGKRPSNLVAKLMGLDPDDLLRVGPTSPMVRAEVGPAPEVRAGPNVLSEIEKKLAHVDFRNSSGNLRALKQIIETMRRAEAGDRMIISPKYVEGRNGKSTSPGRNRQGLSSGDGSRKYRNPPVAGGRPASSPASTNKDRPRLKVENSLDGQVKPTRAGSRPYAKRRLYPRPFEPDTSRTKSKSRPCMRCIVPAHSWDNNKITISPLAKDENRSRGRHKTAEKDELVKGMTSADVGTTSDAETTIDQPSPVSVLDPQLYGDDLSATVRASDNWEESSRDVLESEQVKLEVDSTYDGDADGDRGYVREILSASGLLHGDPDPDTEVVRLDPGVFRLLERARKRRHLTTEIDRTAHRRLVFDVVGEIVTRKPVTKWSRVCGLGLEEHVEVVCEEMERMRARTADVEVCDDVASGVEKRVEISRVVLSIERLIFKDLVDEIVKGDDLRTGAVGVPGRLCRRLF